MLKQNAIYLYFFPLPPIRNASVIKLFIMRSTGNFNLNNIYCLNLAVGVVMVLNNWASVLPRQPHY